MWPPIQAAIAAHAPAKTALGPKPLRFYLFGKVPEVEGAEVEGAGAKPYATWQVINGSPENYLNRRPDIDRMTLQVDVWA